MLAVTESPGIESCDITSPMDVSQLDIVCPVLEIAMSSNVPSRIDQRHFEHSRRIAGDTVVAQA